MFDIGHLRYDYGTPRWNSRQEIVWHGVCFESKQMMRALRQDFRLAMRVHFKNPKLAIVMIATLGIGIGCLTAIFTLIHSVLIRPLNYRDPQKLVRLYESNFSQKLETFSVSPLNWQDWRQSRSFEDLGAFARQQDFNLTFKNQTEQISANQISGNLLDVLGVKPYVGVSFHRITIMPGWKEWPFSASGCGKKNSEATIRSLDKAFF